MHVEGAKGVDTETGLGEGVLAPGKTVHYSVQVMIGDSTGAQVIPDTLDVVYVKEVSICP